MLELDRERNVISGSFQALADAIDRGADLRVAVAFRHNEHLDPKSDNTEIVEEMSDYRIVYRMGKDHTAGIMNLRMPVNGSLGFGPCASWSFFMYHCDGVQGIARVYLDGKAAERAPRYGENPVPAQHSMPKYHVLDRFDRGSNGPAENFIYDFEYFRYYALDNWTEVFSHDAEGKTVNGSLDDLIHEIRAGREVKAAIRNFQLGDGDAEYEVFTYLGSSYYSTESRILHINSQPVVIVHSPDPLRYGSGNWSSGQMLLASDGNIGYWYYDPYTMEYKKTSDRCAVRYFVRNK